MAKKKLPLLTKPTCFDTSKIVEMLESEKIPKEAMRRDDVLSSEITGQYALKQSTELLFQIDQAASGKLKQRMDLFKEIARIDELLYNNDGKVFPLNPS